MQALDCLSMGLYKEGKALLVSAREHLSPEQEYIASRIEALLQSYATYSQAHEELLLASKKFVVADRQQQAEVEQLKALVSGYCQDSHEERTISTLKVSSPQEHLILTNLTPIPTQPTLHEHSLLPALHVLCLGRFEVVRENQPLTLCRNRCGQAILRYLIVQPNHRATMDAMMEVFWPDEEPEGARRKLQVAVSALRRSLNQGYDCEPGGGYILCQNKLYQVNPTISITSDIDTFLTMYEQGRHAKETERIALYEQACQLYTGPFLLEDIYADWASRQREQYSLAYLSMCNTLAEYALGIGDYDATIQWANHILTENRCDEAAYRQLMQAYAAQGRRSEALRQFQRCEHILHEELGISPMPETTRIYHAILSWEGRRNAAQ